MRTPEQGHTRKCLAAAVISAVQNLRDQEHGMSDIEFVLQLQDNRPLQLAYEYLDTGIQTCECPPFYTHRFTFSDGSTYETRVKRDIEYYTSAYERKFQVDESVWVTEVEEL